MKARRWYIRFRGSSSALGPVDFGRPVGEREARRWARQYAQVSRFYGEAWPAADEAWYRSDWWRKQAREFIDL